MWFPYPNYLPPLFSLNGLVLFSSWFSHPFWFSFLPTHILCKSLVTTTLAPHFWFSPVIFTNALIPYFKINFLLLKSVAGFFWLHFFHFPLRLSAFYFRFELLKPKKEKKSHYLCFEVDINKCDDILIRCT